MRAQLNERQSLETPIATFGAVGAPANDPSISANLSASALRRLALNLWGEGKPDSAARFLHAACELAPQDAAIWGDLAGALNAASKPREARLCMEKSLAIDDVQPRSWLLLATICGGLGDDIAAERAFAKSLDLDPMLADAAFGLGILYFRQQRFEAAAEQLRLVVKLGTNNKFVHICLAKALHLVGAFSEAASAYAVAAQFEPAEPLLLQNLALLRLIETTISGTVEQAIAAYRRTAGVHAEDIAKVTETAFHQLSGYGHRDAAIRLGQARLALVPNDPVQRYLLAALSGDELVSAPSDYLVAYFDRFAAGFDKQLVELLGYDVPRTLKVLAASIRPNFSAILDLGCGTGLGATHLRALGGTLTGVDLSPAMLEKASGRKLYDKLVEGEVLAYLSEAKETFDLVFAADLLVYFGKLEALVDAVARRLASGGLFAFSIETSAAGRGAGYRLMPSGRFAHRLAYLESVSRDAFELVATQETKLRLEANRPVEGALVVLRRR
ncbi:Predicted methyltransferase, contains TPR repeat [Rhizobiales bacterium GAS188]|nr:Predicted methyltransferase, contains TPR repeat [Rhizobiales bacterium GAS188]